MAIELSSRATPSHQHTTHQLLRVDSGALVFTHRSASWVIPTGSAVWLPAGCSHRLEALEHATGAALYIRPRTQGHIVDGGPVEISNLLHELMRILSRPIDNPARRTRLEDVVYDELETLELRAFAVALPADRAARQIAVELIADPSNTRSLVDLATAVGASVRTVQRRFRDETGLSFQTWRRRAGLQHATAALARGDNISEVAHQCGFASASAFIAAFRAELGVTPGAWRRDN